MTKQFRPAAVPLLTVDPFFSIWSFSDCLYDDYTRHWTGKKNAMTGFLKIDGKWCKFMGRVSNTADIYTCEPEEMKQISVKVLPLTTIYVFEKEDITLTLEFMTPLILNDLMLMSYPVSYISYSIESKKKHEIEVYFDICSEATVNDNMEKVNFHKTDLSVYCGKGYKDVLGMSGDGVTIDWGYLHLAAPGCEYLIMDTVDREEFFYYNRLPNNKSMRRRVFDGYTSIGVLKKSALSQENPVQGRIHIAYDDIHSIEYMGEMIDAYWKKDGDSFEKMLTSAINEYDSIKKEVDSFNSKLLKEASKYGEKYAEILSLVYRQVVAGHKLTYHDGRTMFFSKECNSNGCIATVDVTMPSQPLFLKYNPDLLAAMIEPVFDYAKTEDWKYDFAPHDVGQYPIANGQVYGYNAKTRKMNLSEQMPVEESGNMLLIVAGICYFKKDYSYAKKHRAILDKWANYLVNKEYDPENQLCTDDFNGRMEHNCNLSIKGILGLAAWGKCLENIGEKGKEYIEIAKKRALEWKKAAYDKECYKLAFDKPGTWSLKYNLVWDRLLELNIFDSDIAQEEIKFYLTKFDKYGMPLDSRAHIGKPDWQIFSSAICENEEYRSKVIEGIWEFISNTNKRVPMSDYYNTENAEYISFQARTTLGALFIHLLF